jgi:hypothetical protein
MARRRRGPLPLPQRLPENRYRWAKRADGTTVRAHTLIAARARGRRVPKGQHVHHKNGNPRDNRTENLEVLAPGAHAQADALRRFEAGESGRRKRVYTYSRKWSKNNKRAVLAHAGERKGKRPKSRRAGQNVRHKTKNRSKKSKVRGMSLRAWLNQPVKW